MGDTFMEEQQQACRYVTHTPEETKELGRQLGERLQPGDVIALEGDLGAGKTTFSQGVALGVGIERPIDSPTFTLIHEYDDGRIPFYHMDAYRLESAEEELGWDEYFYGDGAVLVEWASRIAPWLPEDITWIRLMYAEDGRRITIEAPPDKRERLCVQGGLNR
jgi:tRNA threonylcarbamoyladenosine biosynthesis protein TsaE